MELSQHLKTRMAQRKLAHAYLVVGENRRQLADQLARLLSGEMVHPKRD